MTSVRDLGWSVVRSLVPAAVTYVIGAVTDNFGPVVDDSQKAQLIALAYVVAYGLYYTIARALETFVSARFGWLLGDFRTGQTGPVYPLPDSAVVVPPAPELQKGAPIVPASQVQPPPG